MIHIFIIFTLILLLIILINNIFYLEEEKEENPLNENPLVSIIIPARNEERNIKKCLNAILKQNYKNIEIIVCDDDSKDKTSQIVENYMKKDNRIKLVKINFLPEGWTGKNYACHKGFEISNGEYLIFTDADTVFTNNKTIEYAISKMKEKDLSLLSLIPKIEAISFWEKIFMPLWSFAFITFLPLKLLYSSRDKRLSFAIGPFLMFDRNFYEKMGGHERIKDEIVDDVYLARTTKENGGKIALLNGKDFIKVRFYNNFEEMKKGTIKSIFGAFFYSYKYMFLFLFGAFVIFLLPFVNFLKAILISSPFLLKISFLEISLIYLLKFISDSYNSHDLKYTLLLPVSFLIGFYFCFLSVKIALLKEGYNWKERFYHLPQKY